jgi:hypothetical protein
VEVRGTRDRDVPIVQTVDGVERVTIDLADPPTLNEVDLDRGPGDSIVIGPQTEGDTIAVTLRLDADTTIEVAATDIEFASNGLDNPDPQPQDPVDDVTVITQPTPDQAITLIADIWPVLGAPPDKVAQSQQAVRNPRSQSQEPNYLRRAIETHNTEVNGISVSAGAGAEYDSDQVRITYVITWPARTAFGDAS